MDRPNESGDDGWRCWHAACCWEGENPFAAQAMKKDALLTVSISAFVAALVLTAIPWASAIQNAATVTAAMQPTPASGRAQAERVMTNIVSSVVFSMNGTSNSHSDVQRVLDGQSDCPHCNLKRAYFTGVSFRNANLARADFDGATLTRADFTGAKIEFANFSRADLREARGLTQGQLNTACSDSETRLPPGLHAVPCS